MEVGRPVRRGIANPGLAVAAASLVAGGACFAIAWAAKPAPSVSAVAYGALRVPVINAHLREATAPYLYLAGDSYAELHPAERPPCGLHLVNGGISGIKTGEYARVTRPVVFATPPQVVLLTIGTNDLLAKHDPAGAAAAARFRTDAEALVARLAATGARIVVAALPPIPEQLGSVFEPAGFKLYSDILQAVCTRQGCRFVDPYGASRSEAFWKAKAGASRDGLHLGDLRAAYRSIADALCG